MFSKLKTAISNFRKTWTDISGGYSLSTIMRNWGVSRTRQELLGEFRNLVYQCITTIAHNVARYEPYACKEDPQGNDVRQRDNGLIKLIKNPSPTMSQYDLFEASEIFRRLTGEFFWYFELGQQTGKPKSISLMRPDRVKVAIDDNSGEVIGYTIRRDDGVEIPLELNEVGHMKNFHPLNPYRGYGDVEANLLYIEIENSTSNFQYNYMKNQATPSGVLTFRADSKATIDAEAFKKVKQQWEEQYGGTDNAGKTLFVREMDVSFEKVGLSLADLDMAGLKKLTDDKVREAFKVPKAMLGETDTTGLGRNNIEAIEYIFNKYVVDQSQEKYDDFLLMLYTRFWGNDGIEFDHESQVPDDKEFCLKEKQASVNIWKTVNEVRAEENLAPIPGGDQLYYNFNQVPLGESASANTSTGKVVRLVMKPSTPLSEVRQLDQTALKKSALQSFTDALNRNERATEKRYLQNLKTLIKAQQERVISRLEAHADKGIEKAFDEVTEDSNDEGTKFATVVAPLLLAAINVSGPLAIQFLGMEEQLDFVLTQGARDYIYNSTERLMQSFNSDTVAKLQKTLIQGVNNGESLDQLTARVEAVYADAKGYRAERIANTESHKANNFGVREAYKDAGVKRMVWRAQAGACEFCLAMDGQTADIGGSFLSKGETVTGTDGGEYMADYEDVQLADLHPNCNCLIVPETDE